MRSIIKNFAVASLSLLISNSWAVPITTSQALATPLKQRISALIEKNVAVNDYRKVTYKAYYSTAGNLDRLVVNLFIKGQHRFEKIALVMHGSEVAYVIKPYLAASIQPVKKESFACPDQSVQFIAFAPNDDEFELAITETVALAAEEKGLKTIRLYKQQATRRNYLNYMLCPHVEGNFYDGDAWPQSITTYDDDVTYQDINTYLNQKFNYKMVNIWLACEAYNDPMKSAMLVSAQSQKYAAGVNDLLIGPSDKAAACAMIEALNGSDLSTAFKTCYNKLDVKEDQWGFGGDGSSYMTNR